MSSDFHPCNFEIIAERNVEEHIKSFSAIKINIFKLQNRVKPFTYYANLKGNLNLIIEIRMRLWLKLFYKLFT